MRVLVSTSDKTGLLEFLGPLRAQGLQLVSTGGTYSFLKKNGFEVTEVSEVTKFPEVLDGRVKTLHPALHMGLLADKQNPEHIRQLGEYGVLAFDMVVGNLYPFEAAAKNESSTFEELIENIDIGGPSFLRAAAKNFSSMIVVTSPQDYNWVQNAILKNTLSISDRKKLALKVFSLTSYYDALIVNKLSESSDELEYLNLPLKKKMQLRYGENSHQAATWYFNPLESDGLQSAEIHQGKELSYNNLLDIEAALELVHRLGRPSCVAVKHNNPCGAASAGSLQVAAEKVIQADPKSIFGGIIAFNREVDLSTAHMFKDIFLECLVAPSFTMECLQYLASKKNLRVISVKSDGAALAGLRSVHGGLLRQSADSFNSAEWKFQGATPSDEVLQDMIFGETVAAALKSNAIAIVAGEQTIGLGMGQVNRVDAVEQAVSRMREFQQRVGGAFTPVLVSDAFFPFPDSVDMIAAAGIRWVVQPGGSLQDEKVFAAAKEKNINMAITQRRHFKH